MASARLFVALSRLLEPAVSWLLGRSVELRLRRAVRTDNRSLVQRLVKTHGVDLNAPLQTRKPRASDRPRGHAGFKLLHEAAEVGSFEMVELLLALGARAQVATSWNISPMHLAAHARRPHVVALLAAHGGRVLDPFPCLSTFWEEDPYTPNTIEILKVMGYDHYTGQEHGVYRSGRDATLLHSTTPAPSSPAPRPRL